MPLIFTPLHNIPLIKPGDHLGSIILEAARSEHIEINDNDIFVIAQKVVSKSEGRLRNLTEVIPSQKAIELAEKTGKDPRFVELILGESRKVIRFRWNTIIVEHKAGFICANAGIDHSNVKGEWGLSEDWVLLLPENSDESAKRIRSEIKELCGKNVGVLIIDSHGRAWRNGTVGVTIGLAGVPGLVDLRGNEDLFGFKLKITQVGAADELAAGASLVMGQAAESTPVIHVRGFPYELRESSLNELIRPEEQDLFR